MGKVLYIVWDEPTRWDVLLSSMLPLDGTLQMPRLRDAFGEPKAICVPCTDTGSECGNTEKVVIAPQPTWRT